MIINKKQAQEFHALQYLNEIILISTRDKYKTCFSFIQIDIKDGTTRLTSSDTRQLHIFYDKKEFFKKIKPGLYRLWIVKGEAILTYDKADQTQFKYPDIDKIIPKSYTSNTKVSIHYNKINLNARACSDINNVLTKSGNYINPIYLNQTLKYQGAANCYIGEANTPVVIENKNYLTLIMPMQGRSD